MNSVPLGRVSKPGIYSMFKSIIGNRKRRKKTFRQSPVYDPEILKIKAIVLLFGTSNSFSSIMMQEFMREINEECKGQVRTIFYDIWSPHGMYYSGKYIIRVIPTIIILNKKGQEYFRHEGFFSKEKLLKILKLN